MAEPPVGPVGPDQPAAVPAEPSFRRLSNFSSASEPELLDKVEEDTPTASHALAEESVNAAADDQPKGAAQIEHGEIEVKNLGWNDRVYNVPVPLVGGLDNEQLWTLVRRFDKQMFHVKKLREPPLGTLDMGIAQEEEFSPEKLRAQVERFYMVVIVSLFAFWKQIVRLRSWREYQRTSCFLAVYAVAWLLDILLPSLAIFAIVLIMSDRSRKICFPPAPPSLIDPKTGGIQTPAAGVLASDDSVTGAPEKHQGEAVEQEARNFVTSLSTIVVGTAAGKHPQADPHADGAPDPTELTDTISDARDNTVGLATTDQHDRTRKPMSDAIWAKAGPAMRLVADFVDTWERMGNALSPTAPFPQRRPRLVLSSVLVPMLLASYFTSSYAAMKGMGFGFGFVLFGEPIITKMLSFINRTYPRWEKYVELRNTILRGIPTNAQLTVTLLRIGEKNKAPLPPPPSSDVPPPVVPHATAGQDLEHLGATNEEIQDAIHPDPVQEEVEEEEEEKDKKKHKKSHRIMNLLRGTAKGGIRTALAADKAKAKAGARHAKNRLGVVKNTTSNPATGPIRFPARYKGTKGHAYITATATSPAVSWTPSTEDVKPTWSVSIGDITELRKMGGLGWKSKILVGWAMDREIVDGLNITTTDGKELHLTAVFLRDQLFNRLISMGPQMWESW